MIISLSPTLHCQFHEGRKWVFYSILYTQDSAQTWQVINSRPTSWDRWMTRAWCGRTLWDRWMTRERCEQTLPLGQGGQARNSSGRRCSSWFRILASATRSHRKVSSTDVPRTYVALISLAKTWPDWSQERCRVTGWTRMVGAGGVDCLEERPQHFKMDLPGTSLAVQWLRFHASTAGGLGLMPQGAGIPHAEGTAITSVWWGEVWHQKREFHVISNLDTNVRLYNVGRRHCNQEAYNSKWENGLKSVSLRGVPVLSNCTHARHKHYQLRKDSSHVLNNQILNQNHTA